MKALLLLFFPLLTFGQTVYKGNIVDRNTKVKIPFATVGLIKENVGTNADENGNFALSTLKQKESDTLIFSCIGYETLKIAAAEFKVSQVELDEKANVLAEVIVRKKTWATTTFNEFKSCGNSFVTSGGFMTQLAQHFILPSESGVLKQIKICRIGGFLQPSKAMFRIRVYDMDTVSKAPSTDLCNEVIEVKTRNGVVNLNLEKYKINIPNKNFFVAVEWLRIPYNEQVDKVVFDGQKSERVTYKPSIGTTEPKDLRLHVWFLDYKNKWRMWGGHRSSKVVTTISATVKY